jgi:hypothetical protein
MTTPTEAMHRTIPGEAEGQPLTLGQRIWCLVKDPFTDHLPRPEVLGPLTRETGMH